MSAYSQCCHAACSTPKCRSDKCLSCVASQATGTVQVQPPADISSTAQYRCSHLRTSLQQHSTGAATCRHLFNSTVQMQPPADMASIPAWNVCIRQLISMATPCRIFFISAISTTQFGVTESLQGGLDASERVYDDSLQGSRCIREDL